MDAKGQFRVDDLWRGRLPLPGRSVLTAIARRCGRIWESPQLHRNVRIAYNPHLRSTLGRALLDDRLVELNTRLLTEHPGELVLTLVHELAHVVVHIRYGGAAAPHGLYFRTLMRAVNLSPKATHRLPVAHLRRRRYLYLHCCSDCGYTFIAASVRRNCYCIACGPDMTWHVTRAPDSPEGRKALNRRKEQLAARRGEPSPLRRAQPEI